MDRLFITVKDRPTELAIMCKSLIHSDIAQHIAEVVFLDDHSEDIVSMQRIFSAFSYALLPRRIATRWLDAKDGREGINDSWDRMKHYRCDTIHMMNGDMIVFENYFTKTKELLAKAERKHPDSSVLVSGFNTPLHRAVERDIPLGAIVTKSVGGCALTLRWKNLDKILECLGKPTMNRGFDLHLGEVFDKIYVTDPSVSQHIGIFTGLNQLSLTNFPGAWARVRG